MSEEEGGDSGRGKHMEELLAARASGDDALYKKLLKESIKEKKEALKAEKIEEKVERGALRGQRLKEKALSAGKAAGGAAVGAVAAAPGKIAAGAGRAGRGVAGAYNSANKSFMAAQEMAGQAVVGGVQAGSQSVKVLFVVVAILLHLYDLSRGFSLAGGHRTFMFTAYMLLAFWAGFGHYKSRFSRSTGEHFGVSVIAWGLPFIQLLPGFGSLGAIADNITVLMALTPVWFYYIAFNQKESEQAPPIIRKLAVLLLTLTVFMFFILALAGFALPDFLAPGGQMDVGGSLRNFWYGFKDSSSRIMGGFFDSGIFSPRRWQESLNQTFNPAAHFYSARVEKSEESTGVFIEDLVAPIDRFFLSSNFEVTLLANLNAETVFDTDIEVWPSCRLENYPYAFRGRVEDQNLPIRLNSNLDRPVRCTFQKHPNMTIGSHPAYLAATFDFETWAYITNTFVARSTIENYNAQGRDINRDLRIDRRSEAVFTDGPVMLAIDGDRLPIDIDPEAPTDDILQERLGFTVNNRWPQGKLVEVYEVQLIVPEPFTLNNCFPEGASDVVDGDPNTDDPDRQNVKTYVFSGEVFDDPRYDFKTVTCDLDFASAADANRVLAHGEKIPVTFVAIAKYKYAIEQSTTVTFTEG